MSPALVLAQVGKMEFAKASGKAGTSPLSGTTQTRVAIDQQGLPLRDELSVEQGRARIYPDETCHHFCQYGGKWG